MFHKIDYKNQPKSILLSKGVSNYDKLQKSMNEPLKEYNQIKDLVELENNNIAKINKQSKKNLDMSTSAHKLREMTPHKKR